MPRPTWVDGKAGNTPITAENLDDIADYAEELLGSVSNAVVSVAGKSGAVTLNKSDVGLSNVDNTADANKPLAGDVTGSLSNSLVARIRGKNIPAPGSTEHGKTWVYDHPSGAMVWTALPSTVAGGDLSGTVGNATVDGIHGRSVPVPTAADDGKALVWNAAANSYTWSDVGSGGGGVPGGGGGTTTTGVIEGWEEGDLANFIVSKPAGVTIEANPIAKRSGAYGLYIHKPYTAASGYVRWPMTNSSDAAVEARITYLSQSGQASNGAGIRFMKSGVRIVDIHRDDVTGQMWIRWRKADGTYSFAYTNVIVPLNTQVKLRLRVLYSGAGAVSTIQTEIDGVAVSYRVSSNDATAIAGNTFDLSTGLYDEIQFGSEHTSQLVHCYIDDAILPPRYVGTTYYVSNSGSDTNAGTSALPWKTVAKVNGASLQPGDTVLFERGGFWAEALNITQSGTSARRIKIGAYGSGARPIFDGGGNYANGSPMNPTGPWPTYGVRDPFKLSGNWIVAEEFTVQQALYGGLTITGDDNIARRFTSKWNVAGIHTLAGGDRFEAHHYDLYFNAVMSVNDPGGNNDSGAFGHAIFGADGYFHHATSTGHRAVSQDYGLDGSTIEIYGGKRNRFSCIIANDDHAFSEQGNAGTEDTSYDHCIYYSLAGDGRIGLNVQGSSWGAPLRTKMHHCVIFLPAGTGNAGISIGDLPRWTASTVMSVGQRITPTMVNSKQNGRIYEVTTAGTTDTTEPTWPTTTGNTVTSGGVTFTDRGLQCEFYNNIVYVSWKSGWTGQAIAEDDNIWYGHNTQQVKSIHSATPASDALGTGSFTTNPLFVNSSTPDLHVQAASPAVNNGRDLGYISDYDGLPRAVGLPDIGAYESQ